VLYSEFVTSPELKRWLEGQGCTFEPGKGSHLKVRLGERSSVLPMHGKKDIGKGLENAIKKQLGLK
jgi:mRNA interferase HicA